MKTLFIIVATLYLGAVFTQDIESDSDVLIITDDNLETALSVYDYMLLKYFIPKHSSRRGLDNGYALAAHRLIDHGSQIRLGTVDATNETELVDKFDVQEYPTYMFHHSGSYEEYKGNITFEDILSLEDA